jgi:hypothetical protein
MDVLRRLQLDVILNLFGELALDVAATEERPEAKGDDGEQPIDGHGQAS